MDKLIVSNAPHIHTSDSSRRVMLDVVIALLPATVAAVVIFGTGALKVIAACVIGGVLSFPKRCSILRPTESRPWATSAPSSPGFCLG